MGRRETLEKRQEFLKREISENLNFLIGTVGKSPSMSGYNLTTKIGGRTLTLYVRKSIIPMAKEMTKRYSKVKHLMQRLSKINWELLKTKAK